MTFQMLQILPFIGNAFRDFINRMIFELGLKVQVISIICAINYILGRIIFYINL